MKNWKTLILSSILFAVSSAAQAEQSSLSLAQWDQQLKNQIAQGKTNFTEQFTLSKFEKQFLSRKSNAERKHLAKARELFKKENFAEALKEYDYIQKGSDNWLEAVEEKAWVYHRQKDFEKSLAQTKTLLAEPLIQVVGSEAFFLQSLSQLYICDYPGIFSTQQSFKDSQKERITSIEELAEKGTNAAFEKARSQITSFPLSFEQIGTEAKKLPRLFYKDIKLQKALMNSILTARGARIIEDSGKADLQKTLSVIKKANAKFELQVKARMKELAAAEDKNNQLMIQKMGLIEVETIQRMHADQSLDKKSYKKGKFAQVSNDDLIFPDDGRPWLDELDKYQVQANTCPQNLRRKM